MARGESGRVVVEVDPELKRRLYAALAQTGGTLKDWFVAAAEKHCRNAEQPDLFADAPNPRISTRSNSRRGFPDRLGRE